MRATDKRRKQMMKHFSYGIFISAVAAIAFFASCKENYITYSGPSYIAFADTLSICPVQQDGGPFSIEIAATQACDHDRTFGVEVLPGKSNAVYGYHYRFDSQTVTIKAGERATALAITGNYENIKDTDSLCVSLRLVSAEDYEWDLYGLETRVQLKKVCPFDINNFTGYCLLTSSWFLEYSTSSDITRLIKSELAEDEENTVVLHDFLFDGYDIKIRFDPSDVLDPVVEMTGEQVIGDTREAFNYIYGDGRIWADDAAGMPNMFDTCHDYALLYMTLRVKNVGVIGNYVNILEWLSDEEAENYK